MIDHAWIVIAAVVVSTAIPVSQLRPLVIDTDIKSMMPEHHAERAYALWAEEYFSIEDPALLLVVRDMPDGVFTPEILSLIDHLSSEIMAMEAVDGEDLVSLSETDNITAQGDDLIVAPFFDTPPRDQLQADEIRAAVFANPMMRGTLVSEDGSATVIIAELVAGSDRHAAYAQLKRIVAEAPSTDAKILITGRPVVESELGRLSTLDIERMFPIVLATSITLLWIILGCARGAALPALVVLLSILWVGGVAMSLSSAVVPMISLLPTLIVAVGVADGIHVIHHFLLKLGSGRHVSTRDATLETMDELWAPLVLTSLTTAAGFASLAISPLTGVKWLGVLTALGVMLALLFSLTILPAFLVVLPRPHRAAARLLRSESDSGQPLARGIGHITRLVTERPWTAVAASILLAAVCLVRLGELKVDGSMLQNIPQGNPVKTADEEFVARFGGSQPFNLVLTADEVDAWKAPRHLRAIKSLQDFIDDRGKSGATRSIADYVQRMNAVMNGGDQAQHIIPNDRELIAQYLLLYSISGDPGDLDDVIDYEYRTANVRGNLGSDHSPLVSREIRAVNEFAKSLFGPLGVDVHLTGNARLTLSFVTMIIDGQIASLAIAVIVIALIAGLVFRSFIGGILTCLPVAFATVLNFGWLPWIGSPLGVATAMISSVGIGIGIDYAIHFVVRYRRNRRLGLPAHEAMRETMSTTGVAILFNAIVVMLGFGALSLSQFPPNRAFGQLVALDMAICLISTVTLLATMLHALDPKFLRR